MRAIAVAALTLSWADGAARAADLPYSLRDAALGMTITEARAMKWPDKVYKSQGEPVFICSGDEGFVGGSYEKSLGVTECGWRTAPDKKEYRYSWTTPMLRVGDGMAQDVRYLFMPRDGENEARLFKIDIVMSNNSYPFLVKGLVEKWGKPAKLEKSASQNAYGAVFSDDYTVWRNKVSTIALTERAATIDRMHLIYQLDELNSLYEKRRAAATGAPKL